MDPSLLEDKVCDNKLSICFNNHSEMCGVDIEGCASLSQNLLMNCSIQAASVAIKLVDKIKTAIQIDVKNRYDLLSIILIFLLYFTSINQTKPSSFVFITQT